MESLDWTVYIIEAEDGRLYTGITKDLERRFQAHKKKKGARFFHFSNPHKILFTESHRNRSEASEREAAIKRLTRAEKLTLIAQKAM